MTTLILRTAAGLLVPLSLVFAVFIYFKGHQTPGGGFVAGLVAAVAIIVQRMAMGRGPHGPAPGVWPRRLIAVGLLLAAGGGIGALLAGLPFLTSNYGYLALVADEDPFEWAVVMVFDLGVFLTVTGTVTGMIDALMNEVDL